MGHSTNTCEMNDDIIRDSFISDLIHSHGFNHSAEADNTQMSVSGPVLASRIMYQRVYSIFSHENMRASQWHWWVQNWTCERPTLQLVSPEVFFILGNGALSTCTRASSLDTSFFFILVSLVHQQNHSFLFSWITCITITSLRTPWWLRVQTLEVGWLALKKQVLALN